MGSCCSNLLHHGSCCALRPSFYDKHPQWLCAKAQFQSLGFTDAELKELMTIFTGVDTDGSGEISLAELMEWLDVERTAFTKRVFSIFDEDMSGEIDFREFVVSMVRLLLRIALPSPPSCMEECRLPFTRCFCAATAPRFLVFLFSWPVELLYPKQSGAALVCL